MAQLTTRSTARTLAQDLRRDWGAWSRGERFTASLVGVGVLYLALVILAPGAGTLPW